MGSVQLQASESVRYRTDSVPHYDKTVGANALLETRAQEGVQGSAGNKIHPRLLLWLQTTLCGFALDYYVRGFSEACNELLAVLFYAIFSLMIVPLTVFTYNILRAPALIHAEQESAIEQLQATVSGTEAKIKLIPYPRPDEDYLSIKVFNNDQRPLVCCASLVKLTWLYNRGVELDRTEHVNPNNYKFSWAGGNETEHKSIEPNDYAVLNIAKVQANEIVFTFQKDGKRHPQGLFKIRVELRGKAESEQIKPISFAGYMEARLALEQGYVIRNLDLREELWDISS